MIFNITNISASTDSTRHHHRLAKNTLSELRLLAQSDSPMSGTLTSTNKNGDVIFTTVSHSLALPAHEDIQQGDHLVLMIKEEGEKYFAQILQHNKKASQHKLELHTNTDKQSAQTSTLKDTISVRPFSTEGIVTNVQQSLLRHTIAPLLGMMNRSNIGQHFNVEFTPILDQKQPLPPKSMQGQIVQIMPNNRVEILVKNITIEATLPISLPIDSNIAVKFIETMPQTAISPDAGKTNAKVTQHLPAFLSRINFHWTELENILQNMKAPQLHNLYARISQLLTPQNHQKEVISRLRYIAEGSLDKAPSSAQHHIQNKNAILLHTLAQEFKHIIYNNDPASSTIEIQNTLWHHAQFPFFYEEQMHHLPVYVREDSHRQYVRFIIEPEFENIGRMQIDGIIYFSSNTKEVIEGTIKSIYITVRSMIKLEKDLKDTLGDIIETHSHISGIKSQLDFSVAHYFPIDTPK